MVFEDPSECRIARLILCVGLGGVAIGLFKAAREFFNRTAKGALL